jgi:uncharacterized protein YjaG (DUF416 family)
MNKELLNKRIKELSIEKKLIFSLHNLKRLWPNYTQFSSSVGFGDPSFINKVMHAAKSFVTAKDKEVERLRGELLAIAPDSEIFPSIASTFALDACASCDDVLSLIESEDENAPIRISDLAINTVFTWVMYKQQGHNSETNDAWISNSNEMIEELNFQRKLLEHIIETKFDILFTEILEVNYETIVKL